MFSKITCPIQEKYSVFKVHFSDEDPDNLTFDCRLFREMINSFEVPLNTVIVWTLESTRQHWVHVLSGKVRTIKVSECCHASNEL